MGRNDHRRVVECTYILTGNKTFLLCKWGRYEFFMCYHVESHLILLFISLFLKVIWAIIAAMVSSCVEAVSLLTDVRGLEEQRMLRAESRECGDAGWISVAPILGVLMIFVTYNVIIAATQASWQYNTIIFVGIIFFYILLKHSSTLFLSSKDQTTKDDLNPRDIQLFSP